MVPHQNNYITAIQTQNLLLKNIPGPLHSAIANIISAAMDERLRAAIKFDEPSPFYRNLLNSFLRVRKFFLRYLALPRPKFMVNRLVEENADNEGYRHFSRYEVSTRSFKIIYIRYLAHVSQKCFASSSSCATQLMARSYDSLFKSLESILIEDLRLFRTM